MVFRGPQFERINWRNSKNSYVNVFRLVLSNFHVERETDQIDQRQCRLDEITNTIARRVAGLPCHTLALVAHLPNFDGWKCNAFH